MPGEAPAFPHREVVGRAPFHWRRQFMLARDDVPEGVNYLVLRDTVSGGQPTQWHFWTLSEKIGTPQQAAQREAFLKDKPGSKVAPARRLHGDRFTALGQFDVDLEYYIASPSDTPRYTLRYGTTGGAYGGIRQVREFQDLLHLQLEHDGAYFVALFPHPKDDPAPNFATLADGKVIRISGRFGTDYCFLNHEAADARADEASFSGTAASVQNRASGLVLALAGPGEVGYREYALSAQFPVSLRVGQNVAAVELGQDFPGGEITIELPGAWSLAADYPGAELSGKKGRYVLSVPAGLRCVTLIGRP